MSDEGKQIYNQESLKQVAISLIPIRRILKFWGAKADLAFLGKILGVAGRAERFVVFDISGEGHTAKYLASVFHC
ncbi:hypothetical protein [Flectobacillus longus]|uniref:hypothetical protein n=1 Tax=Flectobacillus longus TaxID=2984207 RepID=UPI0024B6A35B|nr:hypothetical protein [Flectobacillus longus]MDI9877825.1 hypothetical protein [Flectobacillus longus]